MKAAYFLQHGGPEVLRYGEVPDPAAGPGEAVFDTVGGDVAARSLVVLRPGGRAAFIASRGVPLPSVRPDVALLRPNVARDRKHLERVVALVTGGAVRVPEITLYDLSQAAAAHAVSEARHLRGKLVFKLR